MPRQPDFSQFLKVLRRQGRPTHLPFYEHIASPGFIARRMGVPIDRMSWEDPLYWKTYVNFWIGMGFDEVPIEILLNVPFAPPDHAKGGHASEAQAVIHTMADFEKFPWPDESKPVNFKYYETAASFLPEGAKLVAGVCMGPYEWVSLLMGVMGLSYAIFDEPELVTRMFDKIGSLIVSADRQLASMDCVGALRQGDDLGFKTGTFLSSDDIRKFIFPIYTKMTAAAHDASKPFILHSCGNLADIYEGLISDCHIDAKHSFEETILPVEKFKQQYGARVTPLGGLDVDMICRASPDDLRRYTRKKIEQCFADGHYALGTGNSLTNYMPVENYLLVLEEGMKIAG